MLAAELIGKTKEELKDLLSLNTQQYRFDDDAIAASFAVIYDSFVEANNVLIEKQIFWQMVLYGLFGFEEEVIDVFTNTLGSFGFIVLCEAHLGNRQEVQLFTQLYNSHYTKQASLATLLSKVFSAFAEDLNDIKPESINNMLAELNVSLNQFPDFIKNAAK